MGLCSDKMVNEHRTMQVGMKTLVKSNDSGQTRTSISTEAFGALGLLGKIGTGKLKFRMI